MAATTKQLIAHLLRRTTFGPYPGQVNALAHLGIKGAIEEILTRPPLPTNDGPDLSDDGSWEPVRWWLGKMASHSAGIHEKMTWFWHGLVTVSHDKVFWWQVEWDAHLLVRKYAMGDYRRLLKRMTVTPAMLLYLDGSWSTIQGPNENYSRELQELFTIGQENVREANVRNGAMALAGWYVDWDLVKSVFIDESWASLRPNQKVSFMGKQVYRYHQVVDAAIDHPAMPRYIAGKLWYYLVGTKPSATKLSSLAGAYRHSNFNNKVLVRAIVHDPLFLKKRFTRPRYPVEWVTAALAAMGMSRNRDYAVDQLWQMGQMPFYPPSVAGWPTGNRWLSPAIALAKAGVEVDAPAVKAVVDSADPIATALGRASIFEVSSQTRKALIYARNHLSNKSDRATVLLALCLASPEFSLA